MVLDAKHNNAIATLAEAIDTTETTWTFEAADSANLPIPADATEEYDIAVADTTLSNPADDANFEIVRVTGGTGNDRTVVRAQQGTSASTHSSGDQAWIPQTKKDRDDLIAALLADKFAAGTIELDAAGDLAVPTTPRRGTIVVDSNGASGADDLESVSGGEDGQTIQIKIANNARPITIKDGATIKTSFNHDYLLDSTEIHLDLKRDGTVWHVLAPPRHDPRAKLVAWGLFEGDLGTPAFVAGASFGFSSITDNGTGDYDLVFSTAFASANSYAVVVSGEDATAAKGAIMGAIAYNTTDVQIKVNQHNSATAIDCGHASVAVYEVGP